VLSKTVAKNWLFHGKAIKADIALEELNWSKGNYFAAGEDVAQALVLAVGPIQPLNEIPANMPLDAPILFVGGLLQGMVGDNHLTEISTCVADGEGIVGNVANVVKALEAKAWFKAAEDVKATALAVPAALAACEGMDEDIAAIESWAKIFTSKSDLIATVTKHLIRHKKEITGDVQTVKTDWNAKEYYHAGKAAADLITVAIGPIVVPSETEDNLTMDLDALPELAAGFMYGMVGENHLTEFQTCYASATPLWGYLDAALNDLE